MGVFPRKYVHALVKHVRRSTTQVVRRNDSERSQHNELTTTITTRHKNYLRSVPLLQKQVRACSLAPSTEPRERNAQGVEGYGNGAVGIPLSRLCDRR